MKLSSSQRWPLKATHFWIVIGQSFELDTFRVEAAFELHRELRNVVALDSRLVHASSEYILTIIGHFDTIAHYGHVEILYEFDSIAKL